MAANTTNTGPAHPYRPTQPHPTLLHAERHTPRDHITIPPYRILVSTQMIATALISNTVFVHSEMSPQTECTHSVCGNISECALYVELASCGNDLGVSKICAMEQAKVRSDEIGGSELGWGGVGSGKVGWDGVGGGGCISIVGYTLGEYPHVSPGEYPHVSPGEYVPPT